MIKAIYNQLVKFYRYVKNPFKWVFYILFGLTFIPTVLNNEVPAIFNIPWMVVGGSMIIFGFIAAVFHILVGIQLRREGKLDEHGNHIDK